MNILENIVNDSFHQQAYTQLLSAQTHWLQFKAHTQSVLEGNISELNRLRQTWFRVQRQAPSLIPMLTNYYMHQLEQFLNGKFRTRLHNTSTLDQLFLVMFNVYDINQKFLNVLDRNDLVANLGHKISIVLTALQVKERFSDAFSATYRKNCLDIFAEDIIDFDDDVKQFVDERCLSKVGNAIDIKAMKNCVGILSQMNMLAEYFEKPLFDLNKDCLQFVQKCTQPSENQPFLQKSLNYYRTFQRSFIRKLQSVNKSESGEALNKKLIAMMLQLDNNLYFICSKHCSGQILDIVLNFPESKGQNIIQQLQTCIEKSNLLEQVSEKLIKGIQKRLLSPGVLTQAILNQYINMLKVLQIIDPHGQSFEEITSPIKSYLLNRNDTLRCIISHLTEDGDNYLSGRERPPLIMIHSNEVIDDASDNSEEDDAQNWEVLHVRENKTKKLVKYQKIDLVTVLINLYGSQEAFINEYQSMLAEKLMSVKEYNIDDEIKNIELLKMRFGESSLQNCNIIVKDVNDSRKNDKTIHLQASSEAGTLSLKQFNCLAVSKGYWPINYENNTSFSLPAKFQKLFDQYAAEYSKIKAMRKINWHYNLGHADLTLSFENGSFDFKCLPIHAIMISYFDEQKLRNQEGITSEELASQLKIPHHIIKQKMSFWVHKEVVRETRMKQGLSLRRMNSMEDGEVISYRPVDKYVAVAREDLDDDLDTMPAKEGSAMESHLRHIIEGLVISILNINGPKSPEKIHLLLKTVYKTDLDYTYGQVQTTEILKKMAQKKKIFLNGDLYSTKLDCS